MRRESGRARTNGFGFKEGDVAGIIGVRLPARSFWDVALNVVGCGSSS